LERLQLMPDAAMRAQLHRWFAIATAILLGVALGKIIIAFGRSRYNVEFLIILTVIGLGVVWFLVRRRRTHLGNRMLKDLQRLFRALRQRASTIRPGAMTSDAMLLAAVFGISALPATGFADFLRVYNKAGQLGRRLRVIMRIRLRRRGRRRLWRVRRRQLSAATGSGSAGAPNSLPEYLRISTGSI
jgi:hypothetical protein